MAVSEQTPYKEYAGNGVTTSFVLDFDCENKDHLIVTKDGIEPPIGEWSLISGAVVFGTAPSNDVMIAIQRNTPLSRNTDYQSYNNSFRPPAVNKDFDWVWLKLQELGVSDWILGNRIDALKAYVDNQDDELRAYLLEEIRKQGVALDQLEDYYNYLMERLAQIAVDKGWDASFVVDGDRNQKQINSMVLGDNGAAVINLNFTETELSASIKKSLYDVIYDQLIDVTWFGAIGNWNKNTQTGFNSTQAVKNAISYLATLGTRRTGGRRGLKFPKGSYRIDNIELPESLEFGLDVIGDGVKTTNLYFDHNSTNSAIDCQIEFVQFRNMSLIGSLDETWKTTRTSGFKGYLPDNRADIDVTFFNCEIVYWNEFAEINGRGCVFESCMMGLVMCGMNIVVKDYSHGADTDLMQSKFATMRHYTYRNCRFDNCSRAYRVTGSGEMIDNVNNLMLIGCDITNMDLMIEAPNAQFVNSLIACNMAIGSFSTSIIKAKAMHMSGFYLNNCTRSVDYKSLPSTNINSINYVFDFTAPCSHLTATANTIRGLRGAFYRNSSVEESKNISIYGNSLPEFGTYKGGNTAISFMKSGANCKNQLIKDNTFSCSNISGSYYLFNIDSQQQAKDIIYKDNSAPFAWMDRVFSSAPIIYAGTNATTGVISMKTNQYITNGDYVEGYLFLSGTIPETSGPVNVSLPIPAIALNTTFGLSPAGAATIVSATGLSSVGYNHISPIINATTQRIELRKQKDLVLTNVDAADIPANFSLAIEYKYRFK